MSEFNSIISKYHKSVNEGTFTVVLLGALPMGVKLDLRFIKNVIVYNSEINPEVDITILKNSFYIGVSTVHD